MKFYHIADEYIEFLKSYDSKVPENKNESRPYVGVVLEINGIKYYAPFSSPKPKHCKMHNSKDFRKIANGLYGAINFNNMIPVVDEALKYIDISKIEDERYRNLLNHQYQAILSDAKQIEKTAKKLHTLIFKNDTELSEFEKKLKLRCCDLRLLEQVYSEYTKR